MRRGARVGGVSSISGAIESRGAFSVGAGVGPGYLSGGEEEEEDVPSVGPQRPNEKVLCQPPAQNFGPIFVNPLLIFFSSSQILFQSQQDIRMVHN